MVVWGAPDSQGTSAWFSLALDAAQRPIGGPLRLAPAPAAVELVAFGPSGGKAPGFMVLATQARGESRVIETMAVGPQGTLMGGPTVVHETDARVLWVDSVPTDSGTLLLWAEQQGPTASLFALPLGPAGQQEGEPKSVQRGAKAWQVAGAASRIALGTVAAEAPGGVRLTSLDETGAVLGAPVVVSRGGTPANDLDLVTIGRSHLLAWTDLSQGDGQVQVAAVGPKGELTVPPKAATPGLEPEALIRLVAPFDERSTAFLVWERPHERPGATRRLLLAGIDEKGEVSSRAAELSISGGEQLPELVASPRGLAALTLAPACPAAQQDCSGDEAFPTFVELDHDFEPVAAEPLRLDLLNGEVTSSAWGLHCGELGCLALGAVPDTPAPVFLVKLAARSSLWKSPVVRREPARPPFAVASRILRSVDALSDLAVVGADPTLLGWVTYFDPAIPYVRPTRPAPDGRFAPVRALLQVAPLSRDRSLGQIQTVSYRAHSLAGVALAPQEHATLLVWGALDNQVPQVFLTLLDRNGRRISQRMLTSGRGATSEVAAVSAAGDGWMVGWVDERDGNPAGYVARIGRDLQQIGAETRVTEGAGAATGITLLGAGEAISVAWADARDPKHVGWADIYTTRVRTADATLLGKPRLVAATRPHSRSPLLSRWGDGAVLAWLEERASDEESGGVYVAELDSSGRVSGPPSHVPVTGGAPTALAIECQAATGCRVALAVDAATHVELQAFNWKPGRVGRISRLMALAGPAEQSVTLSFCSQDLFYADRGPDGQARLRTLDIVWE